MHCSASAKPRMLARKWPCLLPCSESIFLCCLSSWPAFLVGYCGPEHYIQCSCTCHFLAWDCILNTLFQFPFLFSYTLCQVPDPSNNGGAGSCSSCYLWLERCPLFACLEILYSSRLHRKQRHSFCLGTLFQALSFLHEYSKLTGVTKLHKKVSSGQIAENIK